MASRSLRGLGGPHVALGSLGCGSRVGLRVNSAAWSCWDVPLDGTPAGGGIAALTQRLEATRAEGAGGAIAAWLALLERVEQQLGWASYPAWLGLLCVGTPLPCPLKHSEVARLFRSMVFPEVRRILSVWSRQAWGRGAKLEVQQAETGSLPSSWFLPYPSQAHRKSVPRRVQTGQGTDGPRG